MKVANSEEMHYELVRDVSLSVDGEGAVIHKKEHQRLEIPT